jgi:hypothetical protein
MKTQCPSNQVPELRPGVSSFHQTTTSTPAGTSAALRRQPSPIRKEAFLVALAAHLWLAFGPAALASPYVQLNGAQSRPFYVVAHNPNALDEPEKPDRVAEVDLSPSLLESPEQVVRAFQEAQSKLEFPMNEGQHCRRCAFFGDLCPAKIAVAVR